ncbi:hypothetical protein SARC_03280 [Sphaeroforma arctica JP610]|uniref:Importin-7/11-like TPR repeats domain-containing protein n=1 Tax=Sphaeroforma arctica JP610 TaxID=667725 RepID=A0A0L0G6J6_9EUKA|nr:hypothetical protein SARC_03280 [Sphaeroforma arctica JP610]KNC84506.1 hypothetical protein SARC_03280 [Sphaeroforma arctica JP610]|eukprot:XP_014158408.1 hypothetical protein SARC_03280 [Sphaeroforma arctica JP610]
MATVSDDIETRDYERIPKCISLEEVHTHSPNLHTQCNSLSRLTDSFEPFITPTISAVFSLLTNTDEDETRMRVLQSLAVVLQRCRHQLSTVALNADGSPGLGWEIAKVLFQLWEEATDHHLYQVCLVGNISSLVESMGKSVGASVTDGNANEICLLNPLCQIIATCSDVTNPAHVYLLDDSVLLWKRVVRQLDAPQIPILNVYPRTISLIENVGSEVVRDVMAVLRSYLLVIPDLFFPGSKQVPLVAMATTSPAVASAAESIGQTHVYNLCERLVQALAAWKDSGCKLIVDFIDCALVIGGVGVARGPMRSVVVAMATRMLAENQSDGTDVLVSFSLILARIAVQLPTEDLCSILAEAVVATKNIQIQNDTQNGPVNVASGVEGDRSAAARATMDSFANTSSHATHPGAKRIPTHINTQEEATSYGLCVLLKGWVRRLDQTSSYHSRKLIGLAAPVVLELVARRDAQVLAEEFPMVIDALVSIFGSLANENGSDDCLVMNNDLDTWAPEPGELGETSRERLMQHNDAVYRMSLKNTIQTRMTGLANTDQNGFQNLLSTVSPPVQKQFAELMQ